LESVDKQVMAMLLAEGFTIGITTVREAVAEQTLALNDGDLPELRHQTWKAFQEVHRRRHPNDYGRSARRAFLPTWIRGRRAPEMAGVVEERLR
jgi:hypothetical protein